MTDAPQIRVAMIDDADAMADVCTSSARVGMAVLEDRRGAGIGSRLMEAAEEWAREHAATLMML